jgi:hypothetical protein
MARPRLSDETKKLRGTLEASRTAAALVHGRAALTEPLPPPSGLGHEGRLQWRLHMLQCCAAGTISPINLRTFQALVEAAVLRQKAYRLAMEQGPTAPTADGGSKQSAAWLAFLNADAAYLRWATAFGLTPRAGANLPQLPAPGGTRPWAVS